jgi:hypothetical protein
MDKKEALALKKRYLIWLYKTVREAVDRVERKFTQLEIDRFILKELKKDEGVAGLKKFIEDWEGYVRKKEEEGIMQKFRGKELNPEFQFLLLKLSAIEKSICETLGPKALTEIKALYEAEMTERILKSTEHK